jgi:hypothetical protein
MFQKTSHFSWMKFLLWLQQPCWGVPPRFHPIPSALNFPQGFLKALNHFDTFDSTKFLLLLRVIVHLIHSQLHRYVENIWNDFMFIFLLLSFLLLYPLHRTSNIWMWREFNKPVKIKTCSRTTKVINSLSYIHYSLVPNSNWVLVHLQRYAKAQIQNNYPNIQVFWNGPNLSPVRSSFSLNFFSLNIQLPI